MKLTEYVNFNHKKETFLDQFEFSWDIHGYDRMSQFLPVITKSVTSQMNTAFKMSNQSFAGNKVDTVDYRNAIVLYLKEIHGIRDQSFKYKKINQLLECDQKRQDQKTYIKKVACSPDQITCQNYAIFSQSLYDSEKAQVCILALEAKRQVSLLYLARALSDYMK